MNNIVKKLHHGLHGLVLAGGQSARMGTDKGLLNYHGKPQREWLADLLARYCARVVVSIGIAQTEDGKRMMEDGDAPSSVPSSLSVHLHLPDAPDLAGNGPIGALLTAQRFAPDAPWLVVSCDLPFFEARTVETLLDARRTDAPATAFFNPQNQRPEPLVTIYEVGFLQQLPAHFAAGERSMMRLLHRDATTNLIRDYDPRWIESVDTPEALAEARKILARRNEESKFS